MNSSGAWIHAPPPLAARGFTRRRKQKNRGQGGSGSASLLLPLLTGGEDRRYLQSQANTTTQSVLFCFFFFSFQICFSVDQFFSSDRLCLGSDSTSGGAVGVAVGRCGSLLAVEMVFNPVGGGWVSSSSPPLRMPDRATLLEVGLWASYVSASSLLVTERRRCCPWL